MEFYQSAKFQAWVIIPKITGALSIVGSSLILRDLLRKENRRKKLKSTTNRIVLVMSICDVIFTFVSHFLGTWLVPKVPGVWSTAGNQATCTFQGFVGGLFGAAGTALNATLAVTYVLVVRFGWKDDRLQTYFMSFIFLAMPLIASLGLNLWPLTDQAFNWSGGWTCGYAPAPLGCTVTGDPYPCDRGLQYQKIDAAAVIWGLVCLGLIFVSTVTLYWTVLGRERATDRYAVDESQRSRKMSKKVAMQGIWYAGSFFLTWISFWIVVLLDFATSERPPYWLNTMMAIFIPLQGLFNAVVFFRPRLVSKQKKSIGGNLGSSLRQSSVVRHAIGIFNSTKIKKPPSAGTNTTITSGRSIDIPGTLASAAGNETEQFKDEEGMKEGVSVGNEGP